MRSLMKHVLLLGNQGAAAPTEWVWTVTTTAPAQTVTLHGINPSEAITIDWGDGSSETIAAGNTSSKTHQYANTGAYTVTLPQSVYTAIDLRDAKIGMVITPQNPFPAVTNHVVLSSIPNLTWEVTPTTPFPSVTNYAYLSSLPNLTWEVTPTTPFPAMTDYVYLYSIPNLTWEVTPQNPFPAVTNYVGLYNLPNLTWEVTPTTPFPSVANNVTLYNLPNLTWEVTPTTPFPAVTSSVTLQSLPNLTWEVTPTTPFPAVTSSVTLISLPNLTWEVTPTTPFPAVTSYVTLQSLPNLTWGSGAAANLHSVGAITYENNLLQADVDFVLADLYSVFPSRTKVGTIDLLGTGNAAPSGTLKAACLPTSGKEYAYELVNDSCGVAAFHWTSVTIAS